MRTRVRAYVRAPHSHVPMVRVCDPIMNENNEESFGEVLSSPRPPLSLTLSLSLSLSFLALALSCSLACLLAAWIGQRVRAKFGSVRADRSRPCST
eukprot:1622434-Pleurochrysis_carterae.AAC.2